MQLMQLKKILKNEIRSRDSRDCRDCFDNIIIITIMYFYCNIINYKASSSGHIAVKFTIMTPLEEEGAKYQCRHLLVSAFLPPL